MKTGRLRAPRPSCPLIIVAYVWAAFWGRDASDGLGESRRARYYGRESRVVGLVRVAELGGLHGHRRSLSEVVARRGFRRGRDRQARRPRGLPSGRRRLRRA